MRIMLLILCASLAACATKDDPPAIIKQGGTLQTAYAVCLTRGLTPGTYHFDVCYRARPEVQAHERSTRMNGLGIIHNNRSVYAASRGRSYPVE